MCACDVERVSHAPLCEAFQTNDLAQRKLNPFMHRTEFSEGRPMNVPDAILIYVYVFLTIKAVGAASL